MEHLEFLVEEPSMESALRQIVPKVLGPAQSFLIHPHQGKPDLLNNLVGRLRAYRRWLPPSFGVVVVIDEDRQDCEELKRRLEDAAQRVGLVTRTRNRSAFQVINWIAIEELEAWLLGDADALEAIYPGTGRIIAQRRDLHDPDRVRGGTWEALEDVLEKAGHRGGLRKIEAARAVSARMEVERNRSRSFQGLVRALRDTTRVAN